MKRVLIPLALGLLVAGPALAADASALAKSKNCMACHSVDKKLVGPAYKEVAKKFAGQKDAEATLVTAVMKGSKGVWGPVPMPPNANVNEAEAKQLVDWILSLK
ncbi:cytochrome C-551 [Comamonas faecalis]|uniref:Cytochrome C-551 n=1 Tax=Comamonas faecalis TaxID=1387849 RepID=A0ABP7QWU7_9BURK